MSLPYDILNPNDMNMPDGQTPTVTGNILAEGVKTIVEWTSNTKLTGLSFVVTV